MADWGSRIFPMGNLDFDGIPEELRTTARKRRTVEFYDDGQEASEVRVPPVVAAGRGSTVFDNSISLRDVLVPSPTIVQRAMPHLQRMGLEGLLQHPWNITSAFASHELLDFESRRSAYASNHRLQKVTFSQELFVRLYHLPSTGSPIGQDTDSEFLAKFFCKTGARFGWHFDAVADPQLSAIFQVLNPIFTPERPRQITKSVAMAICRAWENHEQQLNWAAFVWENFCRLKKKKRFFSPFLLHVFKAMGLLGPEEKQFFKNLQNGVVGILGPKSRGRHRRSHARAAGGVKVSTVSRKALPANERMNSPVLGRANVSNHSGIHPGEIVASGGGTIETQPTELVEREESENEAAIESSQSDEDEPDPLETLVRQFKRQRSLFVMISETLECKGDEVLPKVLEMCAAQKSHEKEVLGFGSQVQQERARSERAEEQNNELRGRLTLLQTQSMQEQKPKPEPQESQQMEILRREQKKSEDLRETNLWLKDQNDKLQQQIRLVLKQREEEKAAQEKRLTVEASLLGEFPGELEARRAREALESHALSLQAEVNSLRKKWEQRVQIVWNSAANLRVLATGLDQMLCE